MRFLDKYPQLKERQFFSEMLTKTVYATMALEDQKVSETKVREIVGSLLDRLPTDLANLKSHYSG